MTTFSTASLLAKNGASNGWPSQWKLLARCEHKGSSAIGPHRNGQTVGSGGSFAPLASGKSLETVAFAD
jgi:hypothetical protein